MRLPGFSIIKVFLSILDLGLVVGFVYGGYRWFGDIRRGVNGITIAMLTLYTGLALQSLRLAASPLLHNAVLLSQVWRFTNQVVILLSFYLIDREEEDDEA